MPVTIKPAQMKYKDPVTGEYVPVAALADPAGVIDDTAGSGDTGKTWSADKLNSEKSALNGAIGVSQPTAQESDVGKFLKLKTIDADGKPTEFEYGSASGGGSVTDVQVNGTSVVSQGVANVPMASSNDLGTVKIGSSMTIGSSGAINFGAVSASEVKAGTSYIRALTPERQHASAFYGLAKAAGDSTQSSSNNSVGTYTESAKSAISQMLDAPETVSGSTPTINAKAGVRYICGECSTLTIVVPSTGIIDVVFESGSTATVLTVTPPTGMTMRWIGDDPTALEANKHYEINIMDGCNGMVVSWT